MCAEGMKPRFEEFKVKLTMPMSVAYPDYYYLFMVCTDTSSDEVRSVVFQTHCHSWVHLIHYVSRA